MSQNAVVVLVYACSTVTGIFLGWILREMLEMHRREKAWYWRDHAAPTKICGYELCQHAREDHDEDGICQVLACQCYYFKIAAKP